MLDCEQATGSAGAALHLISDHHNLVLIASLSNPLQKARRHGEKSRLTLNRFDEESRDRRRIDLSDQGLLELRDAEVKIFLLAHATWTPEQIWDRQPHDFRSKGAKTALE